MMVLGAITECGLYEKYVEKAVRIYRGKSFDRADEDAKKTVHSGSSAQKYQIGS